MASAPAEDAARLASVFFLAGATATGKSDVALALARECGGEIVGADAFQVYEGLDLLSAKPGREALAAVPHHLIGVVPLSEAFNVARYREMACAAIDAIRARGRLPIVTGGTGLYLRALLRGLAPLPLPDPLLRLRLEATPLPELVAELETLDPACAAGIDRRNPRRVVRALEVCLLTGRPFSSFRTEWEREPGSSGIHGVVLTRDRTALHQRIALRTRRMFRQGVVEEVRQTPEPGETARQVIGWREIGRLICGEISQAACEEAITQATRQYARRQATWFRRETLLTPVPVAEEATPEAVAAALRPYLPGAKVPPGVPAVRRSG